MPTINQLPSIDQVSGGNQIPTYYSGSGDARKMSVSLLQEYMQENLSFPGVASNASGVNYNPAGTGAVTRTVEAKLRDVVSVKDFGAVGDGVADDTAAIQAALNSGNSLFVPEGAYRVTDTLTITQYGTSLIGVSSPRFTHLSEIVLDSATPKPLIVSSTADLSFKNVKFTSQRLLGYDLIVFGPTSGAADRDIRLVDCTFQGGQNGIVFYGRGLLIENCQLQLFDNSIVLNWVNPWSPGSEGNSDQTPFTGYRAFTVRGCRFHACTGFAVKNVGTNQANMTGLNFTGNMSDTAMGVFFGGARNCTFTGNTFYGASGILFHFFDVDNVAITGNSFAGQYDNSGNVSSRHDADIEHVVYLDNDYSAKNITFTGNTVTNCYKTGFVLLGVWKNIVIANNIFSDMLRGNNDSSLTGVYSVVGIYTAGNGLVFSNNVIALDDWARNQAIVYNAGAPSSGIVNWSIRGNIFTSAYINEHNLLPEYDANNDVYTLQYAGDGTTKTLALAFTPKCVIVACRSGTLVGEIFANAVGTSTTYGVRVVTQGLEISGNANATGSQYALMAFK